jgi:hypothetical protein
VFVEGNLVMRSKAQLKARASELQDEILKATTAADVVRSMDFAAAVDMERLRDIQRTHESLELPRMETTRRSGSTTTHIRKDL